MDCSRLTTIAIPSDVPKIEERTFNGCISLKNVQVSVGLREIHRFAFENCRRLEAFDVDAANAVYSSVDGVLFSKQQTTLIRYPPRRGPIYMIPNTVTTIADSAFAWLTGLGSLTIPDSVTSIGLRAFADSISLTNVVIGSGVRSMGNAIFLGCSSLAKVNFARGVTSIPTLTFSDCVSLTSVNLPETVLDIGWRAFARCFSLRSIEIPRSVSTLDDNVFEGLTSLDRIDVDPLNPFYASVDGVLIDRRKNVLLRCPLAKVGAYSVPNGVKEIALYAFEGCGKITSITLSSSVTNIVYLVFRGCENLERFRVDPANPTYMSIDGVLYNTGETVLLRFPPAKRGNHVIPNSVTSLWHQAFYDCSWVTNLYFEGDAPEMMVIDGYDIAPGLSHSVDSIVFYRAEAKGWRETFATRPTAIWFKVPSYDDWLQTTTLLSGDPERSGESDDADVDGMSNRTELLAGTNPADNRSVLKFDPEHRTADLVEEDRTTLLENEFPLYIRSVPGRSYIVQRAQSLGGTWGTEAVVTASTSQKRVVLHKQDLAFYRVLLAQ